MARLTEQVRIPYTPASLAAFSLELATSRAPCGAAQGGLQECSAALAFNEKLRSAQQLGSQPPQATTASTSLHPAVARGAGLDNCPTWKKAFGSTAPPRCVQGSAAQKGCPEDCTVRPELWCAIFIHTSLDLSALLNPGPERKLSPRPQDVHPCTHEPSRTLPLLLCTWLPSAGQRRHTETGALLQATVEQEREL